jgi:acetoin utilization deacetylase AcuC-like enzyme
MEIADLRSARKVISVLEGGYALQSLASSVAVHVTTLMES